MRLNEEEELVVQTTQGGTYSAVFSFHSPASEEMIEELLNHIKVDLPEDYLNLLRLHNGLELFGSKKFGGAIAFFSIQEILRNLETFREIYSDYDEYGLCIPIGHFPDIGFITLNMSKHKVQHNQYILIMGIIPQTVAGTFEMFFDRLIVSQGSCYWEWIN